VGAATDTARLAHWPADLSAPLIEGSAADLLRRRAATQGDEPAILIPTADHGLEPITYRQLLAHAETCARWLLEHAKPGDRVAIWSRNALESVILQHASGLAGTILAHFNTAWADGEVAHALALVEPALLFVGVDGRGHPLDQRARGMAQCPVVDLYSVFHLRADDPERALPVARPDDPYLIQFTSGTTGRSKGALLNNHAAILGGWLRPFIDGAGEGEIWLNSVPFHHIGGTCAIILGALSMGGAFVMLERYDPTQLAALMNPSKATRMGGVPTMWYDLLERPDVPSKTHLKAITLGGASVAPELVRRIRERFGVECAIGFGQSECTLATGTRLSDSDAVKTETVGKPVPHVEIKISDAATGRTLTFGEVGEIRVRGPTCMDRYWNNEKASAEAFDDEGYLRTGDLGSMAPDGVCRIHGRIRELIIRGGENIYPIEVEQVLHDHPAVAMAAVIGVDDARLGQAVAAVIQLRPGAAVEPQALEAYAAGQVAHYKVPRDWRFVDAMPMTASGKIRKVQLQGMFAAS
jgi:fatty-acyl-CoA synthase